MLDPGAARHLQRPASAVATGRTVMGIAHRLHTASDADRRPGVLDGSHAALRGSWHADATVPDVTGRLLLGRAGVET